MRKWLALGIIICIILAGLLTYVSSEITTFKANNFNPPYTNSYTKAICDQENNCRDYEIFCNEDQFIEIKFTGFAAQFSSNWEDEREPEFKERIC